MLVAFFCIHSQATCNAAEAANTDEKIDMRLLYVGQPGTAREKDFLEFLQAHFKKVEAAAWKGFNFGQAPGFDVIIFDWDERGFDGKRFTAPPVRFPADYTRATLTMGVAGALMCSSAALKTGYL